VAPAPANHFMTIGEDKGTAADSRFGEIRTILFSSEQL
jgi:hypothetical protein